MRLTLIDLSEGMAAEAVRQLSTNARFAAITASRADAAFLPLAGQAFDAAVAMHMLYHLSDPQRAVAEMARVLRPDGLAFATTNAEGNLRELFEIAAAVFGGPACDPAAARMAPDAAADLFRKYFCDVETLLFADSYAIDDADEIVRYLTSMPPGITAPREQRRDLRRLVAERLRRGGGLLRTERECAAIRASRPIWSDSSFVRLAPGPS